MAITCPVTSKAAIELDEYLEIVDTTVDLQDQDSILASAPSLHALSQNARLLDRFLRRPLESAALADSLEGENLYTDATLLLSSSSQRSCFVRANIWRKSKSRAGTFDFDNKLYSYHDGHDHNFDFMTVGYYGSGYHTRIFEYDQSKVTGEIGERVEMRFLEETTLPKGKVMFYRKSVDIHEQFGPDEISVSLNLMTLSPTQRYRQQYRFDLNNGLISGYVDGSQSRRVSILEIAGAIGDENTAELLATIARQNPCPRARAAAYRSFSRLMPSELEATVRGVEADVSPLVRRLFSDGTIL